MHTYIHIVMHINTHKCRYFPSRAWTIAHRREGCEERCGILLGLIYQQLGEVLSGHSSAADLGPGLGPLGDRQTPPRSWGSGKVYHTQTGKCTFTHTPLCFHTLVFHFLIKERRVHVKDMPPSDASCSSCRCVYFLLFFLFFLFCFFFLFGICRLALCACQCCVPSVTRATHSARWTSHQANLHSLHKSWCCHSFEQQMAFPTNNFAQTHAVNFPVSIYSMKFSVYQYMIIIPVFFQTAGMFYRFSSHTYK